MMMTDVRRAGPIRTAGVFAAVVLLAFAACETPTPTGMPPSPDPGVTVVPESAQSVGPVTALRRALAMRGVGAEYGGHLIVVDGVRIVNDETSTVLDNFNPDEIESITVLKGPTAEGLFGNEAAEGAIIIETKAQAEVDGSR